MHDDMMKSVKTWWYSQEWANSKVKEILSNGMIRLLEEGSVLRVVHHENKPLDPHEKLEGKSCGSKPVGRIKEQ